MFIVAVAHAVDTLTLTNWDSSGDCHHIVYELTIEAVGVYVVLLLAILNQLTPSILPSNVRTGAVVIVPQSTSICNLLHHLAKKLPVVELSVVATIVLSISCLYTGVLWLDCNLCILLVNDGVVPHIVWTYLILLPLSLSGGDT